MLHVPLIGIASLFVQGSLFFLIGVIGGAIYAHLTKNPHRGKRGERSASSRTECEDFSPFDNLDDEQAIKRPDSRRLVRQNVVPAKPDLEGGTTLHGGKEISYRKMILAAFAIFSALIVAPTIWGMVSFDSGQQGVVMINPSQASGDGNLVTRRLVAGTYEVGELLHDQLEPDTTFSQTTFAVGEVYAFESNASIYLERKSLEGRYLSDLWGSFEVEMMPLDFIDELSVPAVDNIEPTELYRLTVKRTARGGTSRVSQLVEFEMFMIFVGGADLFFHVPQTGETFLIKKR